MICTNIIMKCRMAIVLYFKGLLFDWQSSSKNNISTILYLRKSSKKNLLECYIILYVIILYIYSLM